MDDHWKRMMKQSLHRCPHCGVTLLIFGAPQIDEYSCKMCGKHITLRRDTNDTEVESSGADHCERSDQVA
jgi:DNA-directed RNA polymerase subunit RPC12/RpoP